MIRQRRNSKVFSTFFVIAAGLILSYPGVCDAAVILFDLESGISMDITDAMESVTGLAEIHGVTAVNPVPGEGDEWLFVEGAAAGSASEYVCIDVATFSGVFRLSETDFRGIFGLPAGEGACSVFHAGGDSVDTLLYYDALYGDWYSLDLLTGAADLFFDVPLAQPFYAGFSYDAPADIGLFVRNTDGNWWFEPFPDRTPIDLDLTALFGADPRHITEFEYGTGPSAFRCVIAVTPGSGPGTPTPTPGPGTPTATPTSGTAAYDVVVMHGGSSEDLWRINAADYSVDPGVAATGIGANQIVPHQGELFVVNSLSHSVTVYDAATLALKREMSTGIGKNPFALAFVDSEHFYVTQFNSNEVTRVNAFSGAIVTHISMPGDLPADPGVETHARPEGITVVDGTAYVACANLVDTFVAGGPGVIVRIATAQDQIAGWAESGGRDCVGVFTDPRWPDRIWTTNAGDYSPGGGFDRNGTIGIYSIGSGIVTDTIPVGDAPFEIVFGGERAYFSSAVDGLVGRLHLDTLSLLPPVSLPGAGAGLNYVSGLKTGPDGRLWVLEFNHDALYTIDTLRDDTLVHELTVGDGPDDLVILE